MIGKDNINRVSFYKKVNIAVLVEIQFIKYFEVQGYGEEFFSN
jgi:hypothetical protein